MNLSPVQIGSVMYVCGFLPSKGNRINSSGQFIGDKKVVTDWLDTAIAICLAESGGDPNAKNKSSSASGLWQIMVSVHEKTIKDFQNYWSSEDNNGKVPTIFDPRVNTSVAQQVYINAGRKWTPWEAYNTGSYKRHLGHGDEVFKFLMNPQRLKAEIALIQQQAAAGQELFQTGAGVINALNPLQNLDKFNWSSFLNDILSFLKQAGMTIGVFVAALVLLLAGLWLLISDTSAGKGAKKLAKKVPPIAAATALKK